jgi:hypothetical protein
MSVRARLASRAKNGIPRPRWVPLCYVASAMFRQRAALLMCTHSAVRISSDPSDAASTQLPSANGLHLLVMIARYLVGRYLEDFVPVGNIPQCEQLIHLS